MKSSLVAESVTHMHPDKICDQISDLILDEHLKQDPLSRVAVETTGGHGYIALFGEVTSKAKIDYEKLVTEFYKNLTRNKIKVEAHISAQSPEISQGVDTGGAGDQGIMVGYACSENDACIPQEMYLCRRLLAGITVDGKSQVTIENGKVTSVVLSVQGENRNGLVKKVKGAGITIEEKYIYANNTGAFDIGGFEADSGCTGRKIVVDAYGPRVPVGGGAFSGKDPTKVDRSAAYMARWVALQLLKKYGAQEVLTQIGYVIGRAEPLIKTAIIDGKEEQIAFDCRPSAIIERFDLRKPIYHDTAKNGHTGRMEELPWESFS